MLLEADTIRLRHMLEAAREAVGFAGSRTRSDLDDHMLSFAIVHAIEIIGEAASRVSPEGRAACPNLPWASIIGMRNRLIHAYYDIDLDRIWETITDDLPPLIVELQAILSEKAPGDADTKRS